MPNSDRWPALPWEEWKDTCNTLHLCMQVVGKVKLALSPFLNEWWEVGFHLTARGMTTGIIPAGREVFEVNFDFTDHTVAIVTVGREVKTLPLNPPTVADFYGSFMAALKDSGIDVTINPVPTEMPNPIPFDEDRARAAYDPEYVHRWWRILIGTDRAIQRYRSPFVGKSSPILFYWGSFDLSEARFSGKPAPPPKGPRFYQVAEDQQNVACGFWPGNPNAAGVTFGKPAFYSYTNPLPDGFAKASVKPSAAYYDETLGEFILPYDEVRGTSSPEDTILEFFQSTYEAGANLAHWDRTTLEQPPARIPRVSRTRGQQDRQPGIGAGTGASVTPDEPEQ